MSKSRYVRPLEPRRCHRCMGILSDRREAYLVVRPDGDIVGPYHAGCAEAEVLAWRADRGTMMSTAQTFGSTKLDAREETLPW